MKYAACMFCLLLCLTNCFIADETPDLLINEEIPASEIENDNQDKISNIMYVSGQSYVRLRQTDLTENPT